MIEIPELRKLAVVACDKFTDIDKAVKYVRKQLDSDQALLDRILDDLINKAILRAIHDVRHDNRTHVKQSASPCKRNRSSLRGIIMDVHKQLFMDAWIVADGITLRHATRAILKVAQKNAEGIRDGNAAIADFYGRIIDKLTNDDMQAGQKLTNKQLEKLWLSIATSYGLPV